MLTGWMCFPIDNLLSPVSKLISTTRSNLHPQVLTHLHLINERSNGCAHLWGQRPSYPSVWVSVTHVMSRVSHLKPDVIGFQPDYKRKMIKKWAFLFVCFKQLQFHPNCERTCPLTGESKRHRSGRRSELRLRLQQRDPAFGCWRWGVCAAGRREGPRRKPEQVQHLLWLPHLPGLKSIYRERETQEEKHHTNQVTQLMCTVCKLMHMKELDTHACIPANTHTHTCISA